MPSIAPIESASIIKKASRSLRQTVPVRCCLVKATPIHRVAGAGTTIAAAVAILLGQPAIVEARVVPPTQLEQSRAQEQELLDIIKQRSGKAFSDLEVTSSPEVKSEAPKAPEKAAPFKLDSSIKVEETTVEPPAFVAPAVTAAAPAAPATPPAPAADLVPSPQEAPKEEVVSTLGPTAPAPATVADGEASGELNSNTLVLGALALVAVVGVGSLGGQQQFEEQAGAASGIPAPVAASASPASATSQDSPSVPPNVAEARAWIAKWKARQQS